MISLMITRLTGMMFAALVVIGNSYQYNPPSGDRPQLNPFCWAL